VEKAPGPQGTASERVAVVHEALWRTLLAAELDRSVSVILMRDFIARLPVDVRKTHDKTRGAVR